ncbi:hypothetical protein CJ178_30895 [Rhodococcus sp. ACPA4]|nr:hypothetical protein CJ178_30895 [Rhodococcus sp. ACPA4]
MHADDADTPKVAATERTGQMNVFGAAVSAARKNQIIDAVTYDDGILMVTVPVAEAQSPESTSRSRRQLTRAARRTE